MGAQIGAGFVAAVCADALGGNGHPAVSIAAGGAGFNKADAVVVRLSRQPTSATRIS